jgi:uncharacterized damage-inducible protein DinB
MSKSYFIELSEYNIWANDRVCSWMDKISDEQWNRIVISSFDSIYQTILHIAASEKIWLERLEKSMVSEMLTKTFNGSKWELIKTWKEISQNFKTFIQNMPEDLLSQNLYYRNTRGEEFNQPYYQLLAHVFNHTTYHRGQVVSMLRQVGFTDLNSTDMTTFYRIQNKLPIQMFSK